MVSGGTRCVTWRDNWSLPPRPVRPICVRPVRVRRPVSPEKRALYRERAAARERERNARWWIKKLSGFIDEARRMNYAD